MKKGEGLPAYPYRLVATPTYPDCKCTKNNLKKEHNTIKININ